MPVRKVTVTPFVRSLFSNVPIEAGLTDADIIASTSAQIAPQTFSRHRIKLPLLIPAEELILVARVAQKHLGQDAAKIIATVRDGIANRKDADYASLCGQSVATSAKQRLGIERLTEALAKSSKRIYLFDQSNSFSYFSPDCDDTQTGEAIVSDSRWLDHPQSLLRYARTPRIFGVLTKLSLLARLKSLGDEGIEHLIGNLEVSEHSLSVIDDSPRMAHRVFRGIFADAQAVAIFDRKVMIVYPRHQRSFRVYNAAENHMHAKFIRDAIREFHRLRRFRMHPVSALGTIAYLKKYLSYVIPEPAA